MILEEMPAPVPILQTLWGVRESEARHINRHFVERSLAQREAAGGIRLHDLVLDYVRAIWPDREALALIHEALRLSSHVLARDPAQFASQFTARLLPFCRENHGDSAICQFAAAITKFAPRPWIRSLRPALHAPGTGLFRTLEGHSDLVLGVALTSDGRRAVSASDDKTLKVWDLEVGRKLRTLKGHSDVVTGVAVAGDGPSAVSASFDETLKVSDLESGHELRTLKDHTGLVIGVAVTGDRRRAVSASDKTLKVWDLENGTVMSTFTADGAAVHSRAIE